MNRSVIVGGMHMDYAETPSPVVVSSPSSTEEPPLVTEEEFYNVSTACLQTYINSTDSSPDLFRFVMYGFFLNIVSLLGLVGNVISITVLSRPKMRSSINCCLIGLSVFDMIVSTTSFLIFGMPEVCDFTGSMKWYSENVFVKITPFIFPVALIAQTGSVYLTVTVTMERYVAVCRPLRARSLCTYGRAKIYVITVAFFSVLYNLPRFWEVSYVECVDAVGAIVISLDATSLRRNINYIQIYIMWMYLFVMYLIPFLSLMFFNAFIYREVRIANKERQRLSRLEKKEIGLAVMLLVVVTVFFLCNVLAFIINIMEMQGHELSELTVTSNLLVTVNSSVNFIIYCIFGQKFRRLFLKMFCSRFVPSVIRRGTTFRDSGAYGNNSMCHTNGRSTQIIRMSSWNGSQRSRSESNSCPQPEGNGNQGSRSSWRPFSKYSSVPLGDSSTPRTASSSFTPSRSPSLVPPQTGESDHAL